MFARLLYFMDEHRTKQSGRELSWAWGCPVYQAVDHRAGGFLGDQWGLGDLPYFWASDVCSMLVGSVLVLWVGFSGEGSVRGREGEREGEREREGGRRREGNMTQAKEACLGLPEDALPTPCSSDPCMAETPLVFSLPVTLL